MAFEQDLRAYLERRDHESSGASQLVRRQIDVNLLHRHLLDRLREMEQAGETEAVERLFAEWPGKLPSFARYIETLPKLAAPVERSELGQFARWALDAALDQLDAGLPLVDRLELQRIASEFVDDDVLVARYALENRLVRVGRRRRPKLTELGRVFTQLRGRDAIRWLLTNEVLQSVGRRDPWHACYALLDDAMDASGIPLDECDGEIRFVYDDLTLDRLLDLGLLRLFKDDSAGVFRYQALESMRDVLQAVRSKGLGTPLSARCLMMNEPRFFRSRRRAQPKRLSSRRS